MKKKIVFLGGGPAGYEGAIRGAQLGAEITIIEKTALGGTCLNKGCIPTKAMYKNAKVINSVRDGATYGVDITSFDVNFSKIMERKDEVVGKLRSGVEKLMSDYGIKIIKGTGKFTSSNSIEVVLEDGTKEIVDGDAFIIATGSAPFIPSVEGIDGPKVITSDELLELKELPKKLIVAGGGVIGLEFAYIFNAFGSEVSIISNALAKRTDSEISKRLNSIVKKEGINFVSKSHLKCVKHEGDEVIVTAEGKAGETELRGDYLLAAIGRVPVVEKLGLEDIGVEFSNKGIKVDEAYRTNISGVYAVGDVIGGSMLAHVASHEAIDAVEIIMGLKEKGKHKPVPDCIFIEPQIAYVGETEEELKESGRNYIKGKFMFVSNGKALAMGETTGFVKILADSESHEILGVHILGPNASDLIHEGTLAMTHHMTIEDLTKMIHAHPTLAEAVLEAALDTIDSSIHLSPKSK